MVTELLVCVGSCNVQLTLNNFLFVAYKVSLCLLLQLSVQEHLRDTSMDYQDLHYTQVHMRKSFTLLTVVRCYICAPFSDDITVSKFLPFQFYVLVSLLACIYRYLQHITVIAVKK